MSPGLMTASIESANSPLYHWASYQPVRQTADLVAAPSSKDRPACSRTAREYGSAIAVASAKSPMSE
jgi:hypothetical protein